MPNHKLFWAVAQQLTILDGGDAPLIETIQNGHRPPNLLVERFLKDYKLWRFGGFKRQPSRLDAFIDVAERRFRPRPADLSAASRAWLDAVKRIQRPKPPWTPLLGISQILLVLSASHAHDV
jgi:hypothetical protein